MSDIQDDIETEGVVEEPPPPPPPPPPGTKRTLIVTLVIIGIVLLILLPAFGFALKTYGNPRTTAPESVVAICVSVFAAMIALWILDATDLLNFRYPWISKAIWATAIASILTTSVAVYKEIGGQPPLSGDWKATLYDDGGKRIVNLDVVLAFDSRSKNYKGFSDAKPVGSNYMWVEIGDLSPDDSKVSFNVGNSATAEQNIGTTFTLARSDTIIDTKVAEHYRLHMNR